MSRTCILTGKRANVANNRSHSNQATKRTQGVNLQVRHIGGTRLRLSAEAVKSLIKMHALQSGELLTKRQKKLAKTAARKAKVAK